MSNTDGAEIMKLLAEERVQWLALIWKNFATMPSDVPQKFDHSVKSQSQRFSHSEHAAKADLIP